MFSKINTILTYLFIFLFPLFFLPLTVDMYEYNKLFLTIIYVSLFGIFFILDVFRSKKLEFKKTPFFSLLLLLFIPSFISLIFQKPNFLGAISSSQLPVILGAGVLCYFSIRQADIDRKKVVYTLLSGSVIISIYTVLAFFKITGNTGFTPAGSTIITLCYLISIAVFIVSSYIFEKKKNHEAGKRIPPIIYIVTFAFILLALGFILFSLVSSKDTVLILPFIYGWGILLEIFKNIKTLFLGIGPGNFLTAFTLGKPVAINYSPYWNILFTSSSSWLLTLMTETGIISGFFYLLLFLKSFRLLFYNQTSSDHYSPPYLSGVITVFLLMAILPSGMTVFLTAVTMLALSSLEEKPKSFDLSPYTKALYSTGVSLIGFFIFILYIYGYFYYSESIFKKSIDSLVYEKGKNTYSLQTQAISLNPYIDRYHVSFSQTSLAMANNISSNKDLTDDDKKNIPRLVQQAIDQGRIAVSLNSVSVVNWENLMQIYSSLIGYAKGAEDWAVQAGGQRVGIDPVSPNGYISLGGLYLRLNSPKNAELQFRKSIETKRDFANGYYNLGLSLKMQKNYSEAYQSIATAKTLAANTTENKEGLDKIDADLKELLKLDPTINATPSAADK